MESNLQKRLSKIEGFREELAELQETLADVEVATMNSGSAVSLRYIAHRITEIAESLRELDKAA